MAVGVRERSQEQVFSLGNWERELGSVDGEEIRNTLFNK